MKNTHFTKVFMLALALAACQKPVSPTGTGVGGNLEEPKDDSIKLCDDGTLNCLVDLPKDSITLPNVAFETCVKQCLKDDGCSTWDSNPTACVDSDPNTAPNYDYQACSDSCDMFSPDGALGSLPKSDDFKIPDQPRKAFTVHIEGCFDSRVITETHFNGTQFHFDTVDSGQTADKINRILKFATFGLSKSIKNGAASRVGRNSACSSGVKNQVKVTFTPIIASTVQLDRVSIPITPFTTKDAVDLTCKMPHSSACGIPQAIRDELDLKQMTWFLQGMDHGGPGFNTFVNGMFVNNNIAGGTTIVTVMPIGITPIREKMDMVVFASSN